MGVLTIIASLFSIFLAPFSLKIRHKIALIWTWCFNFLARNLCGVKYEVFGKEHIPDAQSIIISNHQSAWETLCFSQIFPPHVWILKRALLSIPFFGWALKMCSPIAINRNNGIISIKQVIDQGKERFNNGFWILAFPEGTRMLPQHRVRYKIGAFQLSKVLNAPIVPVAHNAGYCFPKGQFCLFPGKITVIICPAVYSVNEDAVNLMQTVESCINQELIKLNA
ncbi:MAG: lysophospholipid acyltransferase family protein [Burkholderiales bacterium]|nr:lysophospholipid acyltransferase family protein [Burkholderiales bacterium]